MLIVGYKTSLDNLLRFYSCIKVFKILFYKKTLVNTLFDQIFFDRLIRNKYRYAYKYNLTIYVKLIDKTFKKQ